MLAPDWAWGHYARALVVREREPEDAARELQSCITADPTAKEAYDLLIELQEKRLHRIDDALGTATQLASQKDIRPTLRMSQMWRLELVKSDYSEESKNTPNDELKQLTSRTQEVNMPEAICAGYLYLLKDAANAKLVQEKIESLDPGWTPERGWIYTRINTNRSGVPRYVVLVNRQIALNQKVTEVTGVIDIGPAEKIERLEQLLLHDPNRELRRVIFQKIFDIAIKSNDPQTALKYGLLLNRIDADDSALLADLARVLADRPVLLDQAAYFAQRAKRLTDKFRPAKRPLNTPQSLFDEVFPVATQRVQYSRNRAKALDTIGWVFVQSGRPKQGEPFLRGALRIEKTEERLHHLGQALQRLNRVAEAMEVNLEAQNFLAASIRTKFISEKIDDLQTQSLEGQAINLVEFKGKVILVTFWASWCVPCRQEIPELKLLFEKFKEQGLKIIAVSIDEDIDKARTFVVDNKLPFLVADDRSLAKQFIEQGIPLTLFIDKMGALRYRKLGYDAADARDATGVPNTWSVALI
ncbi:MAG TPA: redoxin domain-containing protein [Pyrinomonadaceae bacterium]